MSTTRITPLLALALAVAPSFAADSRGTVPVNPVPGPNPVTAAAGVRVDALASQIEALLPGNTETAMFINVRRLFSLYGDLIARSDLGKRLAKYVAQGCPDPSKDVDQIGYVASLEDLEKADLGLVATGNIDSGKLMSFLATQNATFTASCFHGVKLETGTMDHKSVQLAFPEGGPVVVSVDTKGEHSKTKEILAVLDEHAPSFSDAHNFHLQDTYLVNFSLKVTDAMRRTLASLPSAYMPIRAIVFASGSVAATEATADATVTIDLTCDAAQNAGLLKAFLDAFIQQAAGNGHGSPASELQHISVTQKDTVVTLSLTIPRHDMEGWVGH